MLCYVDESDQGNYFAFAGIMLKPGAVSELSRELDEVVRAATCAFDVSPHAELHAHPIFHGKDDWSALPPRARVDVFTKVVSTSLVHSERILLRAVNRSALARRQNRRGYPEAHSAERVCLTHILQRANIIAEARQSHTLVIADERSDRDVHRDLFAAFQRNGTPGEYMRSNLTYLIDTIHFAPSSHSRALQAADMLAFLYRRRLTTREPTGQAQVAMDGLWRQIQDSRREYETGVWP